MTGAQVPLAAPVFAFEQARHRSEHAPSQHTPSTQWFDWHWFDAVQVCPWARFETQAFPEQ